MIRWKFLVMRLIGALMPILLLYPADAAAQMPAFPEKGRAITLIVPYGPGGMIDTMGRLLAGYWDAKWGTHTIVLNKPGANGQIGFAEMFKQKRDGYTIAFTHSFDTQMTYLDPEADAPFSRSDFMPVGLTQWTPAIWVVRADSSYQVGKDLVEAAKARPGQISIASPAARGVTVAHAKVLDSRLGARMSVVPYNDVPTAINALLGGHVDVVFSNVAVALPHVKAGKLRVLMVIGNRRLKYFPDAPTSAEQGYTLADVSNTGLSLGSGTPKPALDAWTAMLAGAIADPQIRTKMDSLGVNLEFLSSEQYSRLWSEVEDSVKSVLIEQVGRVKVIK